MDSFLTLFDMIGVLARRRYQAAERSFASLGLNHTEARLLTLLRQEAAAVPQDALSNQIHVDRTNAGRALKRLEQDGYVARRRDESDKRTNFVAITPKGRLAAADIAKLKKKMAQNFFGDLKADEASAIAKRLEKAISNVSEAAPLNLPGKRKR